MALWVAAGGRGINVWIKGRGNTAVKLKQERRGHRAGDYVGGGKAKRLISPSQYHQEGVRVVAAESWVRISSGVDYAVFIAVMQQKVAGGGLLGVKDGSSTNNGEDIYGSGGGKGCVSGREDVGGGGGVGDGGVGIHG